MQFVTARIVAIGGHADGHGAFTQEEAKSARQRRRGRMVERGADWG